MQTFLPSPDFDESASILDPKRLNNQINECTILLRAIREPEGPWGNHVVTRMWRGHEGALKHYRNACLCAYIRRTGKSPDFPMNFKLLFGHLDSRHGDWTLPKFFTSMPEWLGMDKLHSHHRAKLLAKDPEYYGQFGWQEEPNPSSWYPLKWGKEYQHEQRQRARLLKSSTS